MDEAFCFVAYYIIAECRMKRAQCPNPDMISWRVAKYVSCSVQKPNGMIRFPKVITSQRYSFKHGLLSVDRVRQQASESDNARARESLWWCEPLERKPHPPSRILKGQTLEAKLPHTKAPGSLDQLRVIFCFLGGEGRGVFGAAWLDSTSPVCL